MEIVRDKEKRTLAPTPSVTIHEYDMHDGFVSGALVELKGRYPDKGYCINTKIKELVYVGSGTGQLIQPDKTTDFAPGDSIFIDHGEKFAWLGQCSLYMATTPTFDPAQHLEVD